MRLLARHRDVARGQLAVDYAHCRDVTREHGTTYFWGARILPPQQRNDVYAVYALCRTADDIVDAPGATGGDADRLALTTSSLEAFVDQWHHANTGVYSPNPVIRAAVNSVQRRGISPECFDRFFAAMMQDLTVDHYDTYSDLLGYTEGSASVIGEMMLPVLNPTNYDAAFGPARDLGLAFQLTNFLRDFVEDQGRRRTYLPLEDFERFGVSRWQHRVDDGWRAFAAFQIARIRELYDASDAGIAHLPTASARCVYTARRLYSQILDLIEGADYDVFSGRVRVPTLRKAAFAAKMLVTTPDVVAS